MWQRELFAAGSSVNMGILRGGPPEVLRVQNQKHWAKRQDSRTFLSNYGTIYTFLRHIGNLDSIGSLFQNPFGG
jgi:hypothetical protein